MRIRSALIVAALGLSGCTLYADLGRFEEFVDIDGGTDSGIDAGPPEDAGIDASSPEDGGEIGDGGMEDPDASAP